jgi:hypothetical protein
MFFWFIGFVIAWVLLRALYERKQRESLRESIRSNSVAMLIHLPLHKTCCGASACKLDTQCQPGNCGACAGNRPCGGAYPREICPWKRSCDILAECRALLQQNLPDRLLDKTLFELRALDKQFEESLRKLERLQILP